MSEIADGWLLQSESLGDQSLQPRLVQKIVGKFLVWEHGQSRAFGVGREF